MQAGLAGAALGAGGLRTAHRLHQYGRASTVYEANIRIGGRMYFNSDYFMGGRVVEWGGELISTEHTSLRKLAHQLKLEDANKSSVGEEEVYLIDGVLRSGADLLAEWLGGLYELVKRAQQEAPWQPFYNAYTEAHHSRGAFISPDIGAIRSAERVAQEIAQG